MTKAEISEVIDSISAKEPEATTVVTEKRKSQVFYIAVVECIHEHEDMENPIFIYAKSKIELSKKLSSSKIISIFGIFKGKKIDFTRQSVIKF